MYCTVCQQEYIFLNIFWRAEVYWPLHCSVLGIRDILVHIRIQLLSSVTTGTLSSVLKINFMKNCVLKFYFASITVFKSAQHIYEKTEGSGVGSGSVPLTNGSGSGRPKNMWIRFRIRIRIPNTAFAYIAHFVLWRDVWIRIHRAAVANRRATNLATHLPQE
jgi:hypothetical protein